jgi:hypothetical protein
MLTLTRTHTQEEMLEEVYQFRGHVRELRAQMQADGTLGAGYPPGSNEGRR